MRPYFKVLFIFLSLINLPLASYGQCKACQGITLPEPLFLQGPDSLCAERKDLVIKASRLTQAGAKYIWRIPNQPDTMTTDSILRIPNPTVRNSGNYSVAIMLDTCCTPFFGPINVQVVGAQKASADTITTIVSCNSSEIVVTSTYKTNNNVFGQWVGTEGVIFENPKSATTLVKNLKEGENLAIWMLSTSVCPFFIKDTFRIRHEVKPTLETAGISLRAGEASTTIHLGKVAGSNLDILKDVEIKITKPPRHGTLERLSDGKRLKYNRNADFSGRDAFEIKVCNLKCLNLCSAPIPYTIDVIFDPRYPNVGMPKILAPKESNEARLYLIEKIENYPKNELRILNRWGNTILKFIDYNNQGAWDGSSDNGSVSPGAYYYWLQAYDKEDKPLRPLTGIFYIIQ